MSEGWRTVFVAGAFSHPPLLAAILGGEVYGHEARLPGYAALWSVSAALTPVIRASGNDLDGIMMSLDEARLARMDYHAAVWGAVPDDRAVLAGDEEIPARVYLDGGKAAVAGVWDGFDMDLWAGIWGEIVTQTAGDVMAGFGTVPPEAMAARLPQMLVRGASRVRAVQTAPLTRRFRARPADLQVHQRHLPYAEFFSVEEYDLTWRRFDGEMGAPLRRAVFVSGDAVTVLPYDPARDVVLLIEQFRPGPMARGDGQPWLLEPIAGRIDPGETPEQAARREAAEEAGLIMGELMPVAGYYPSPGAKTEYLYSYVALTDLPADVTGFFGLATEGEDIRSHLVPFAELMQMVTSGEAANAPLILSALWLQRERERLLGEQAELQVRRLMEAELPPTGLPEDKPGS